MFDEKTVGGALVDPQDDAHYVLCAMFIAPESQNQGLGTRAIRLLEATHPTAAKWSLATAYSSHKSQRFYERLGYQRRSMVRFREPEIIDAVCLEKVFKLKE